MTVHNFTKSLAASHDFEDAGWWEVVYRNAFHNFAGMTNTREDGWAQRGGIDRVVSLGSGKTLTIDEKVRTKDYPDILLERWSDRDRKAPGWVQQDLACDYIAYAFIPSQRCYLLPFQELRRAWIQHGREWANQYPAVLARNERSGRKWVTECVPIPIPVLKEALIAVSEISWAPELVPA